MSAPVITGFHAPAEAAHGTPFAVTVEAHDPDAKTVNFTTTVTNPAGEAASQSAAVDLSAGPLTITLVCDDPAVVITPGAAPGEFTVTA